MNQHLKQHGYICLRITAHPDNNKRLTQQKRITTYLITSTN